MHEVPSFRESYWPQSSESKYQQRTDVEIVNAIGIRSAYAVHCNRERERERVWSARIVLPAHVNSHSILFNISSWRCGASLRPSIEGECMARERSQTFGAAHASAWFEEAVARYPSDCMRRQQRQPHHFAESAVPTGTRSKRPFSLAENFNDTRRVFLSTFRSV